MKAPRHTPSLRGRHVGSGSGPEMKYVNLNERPAPKAAARPRPKPKPKIQKFDMGGPVQQINQDGGVPTGQQIPQPLSGAGTGALPAQQPVTPPQQVPQPLAGIPSGAMGSNVNSAALAQGGLWPGMPTSSIQYPGMQNMLGRPY